MKTEINISVRDLVEFVLMGGDLSFGGFAASDRAREGQRIHRKIQRSRGDNYQKEVPVTKIVDSGDLQIKISGRIDGIITTDDLPVIEEIKTIRSGLNNYLAKEDPLHWGQAKVYALIYAEQNELQAVSVQLTYYEIQSEKQAERNQDFSLAQLTSFFNTLLEKYLNWIKQIEAWQQKRNRKLKNFQFPFETYRKGQKEMAVAVYKTVRSNSQLLVQAPTGIGKTAAALYPALKALAEDHTRKIFFIAARTTGKQAAVDALESFINQDGEVKYIVLTAKDKICFEPEAECEPTECRFARGFYDKLPAAREELFKEYSYTREKLEDIALKHEICPFEFSLDMALWSDCVIGDYNYVFDLRTKLKRFFGEDQNSLKNNYSLLVDEAHNLVDRARDMFSAELHKADILSIRRKLKKQLPAIYKSLSRINSWFLKKKKEYLTKADYFNAAELTGELVPLLNKFSAMTEKWLSHNIRTSFRAELLELYFKVHWFLKINELYGDNYTTCLEREKNNIIVKYFCLDPSELLKSALKQVTSAVFFSATLTPASYFKDLFGLADTAQAISFSSPFPAENLNVFSELTISTKYKDREKTLKQLTDVIAHFIFRKKGNYLIFFPSYNYMQQVVDLLGPELEKIRVLIQSVNMSEQDRSSYIEAFSHDNHVTTVGFAVLGGVFGEGIDLIGNRLDGAVIVSVGLPGISFERDLIREFYDKTGQGFDYAYKFPGLTRVLQAAGRVIRTETDKGEILLIDSRFGNYHYRKLLPREWKMRKYKA